MQIQNTKMCSPTPIKLTATILLENKCWKWR